MHFYYIKDINEKDKYRFEVKYQTENIFSLPIV